MVSPSTGGRLYVGCVRMRWTWRVGKWPALLLDFIIRAFRLLRQPWLGAYSHVFLWHNTDIWEARKEWTKGTIYSYDDPAYLVDAYEVCNLDGKGLSWKQIQTILDFADDLCGVPYDFPQLALIALFELGIITVDEPRPDDPRKPICSTGVAACYKKVGIDLPRLAGVKLWRFAPDHFAKLHRLYPSVVRFRGRLKFLKGDN